MKTSLTLSNAQQFFNHLNPSIDGSKTAVEILVELEKKIQNTKYLIDLEKTVLIEIRDDSANVIFDLVDINKDMFGNLVVTYEYSTTILG